MTSFQLGERYLGFGLLILPILMHLKTQNDIPLYKSKLDIVEYILENTLTAMKETVLTHKRNINPSEFDLCKECLIEAGFLETSRLEKGIEICKATPKGQQFLRDYKHIKTILN